MNLPHHRRTQEGGMMPACTQIETPPMIKIITTKPNVSSVSVSFSIIPYSCIRVQQTSINIDDQAARGPSNQVCANQFKYITLREIQGFYPKSCNLVPSSNHFVNLVQ